MKSDKNTRWRNASASGWQEEALRPNVTLAGSQHALPISNVDPTLVLEPDFLEVCDLPQPKSFVERDATHRGVDTSRLQSWEEIAIEFRTDPAS